jgi:hypothetical protein
MTVANSAGTTIVAPGTAITTGDTRVWMIVEDGPADPVSALTGLLATMTRRQAWGAIASQPFHHTVTVGAFACPLDGRPLASVHPGEQLVTAQQTGNLGNTSACSRDTGECDHDDNVARVTCSVVSAPAGFVASALGADMFLFEHRAAPQPPAPRQHVYLTLTTMSPSSIDSSQTRRHTVSSALPWAWTHLVSRTPRYAAIKGWATVRRMCFS